MFQHIVVCVKNELLAKEIVTPMTNCLNNCIELSVIGVVASSRTCNFFTKESHMASLLTKDCANSCFTSINLQASQCNSKTAEKSGKAKTGADTIRSFIVVNALSAAAIHKKVEPFIQSFNGEVRTLKF